MRHQHRLPQNATDRSTWLLMQQIEAVPIIEEGCKSAVELDPNALVSFAYTTLLWIGLRKVV